MENTSVRGDYTPYSRFLDRSLVVLDDFAPDYTDFEQFANTGLAYLGRAVVTYSPNDFGEGYLKYLESEQLSPNPLQFLMMRNRARGLKGAILNGHMKDTKRVIAELGLDYLQPFMATEDSVEIADKLGLDMYSNLRNVADLNDKIYMKRMASELEVRVLGDYVAETIQEAKDLFDMLGSGQDFPVIYKGCFSCGGQGNYVIPHHQSLDRFLQDCFDQEKPFVVEPLIDVISSPCTLLFISPDGKVNYLGMNEQIIRDNSACIGSRFPADPSERVKKDVLEFTDKLGAKIAETGYYGPLGFDFIVDESGNAYFLEANVRINYTHVMLDMLNNLGMPHGLLGDIKPSTAYKNMSEVIARMDQKDLLTRDKGGIFPFYPQYNCTKLKEFAVIIAGDDPEQLVESYERCKREIS